MAKVGNATVIDLDSDTDDEPVAMANIPLTASTRGIPQYIDLVEDAIEVEEERDEEENDEEEEDEEEIEDDDHWWHPDDPRFNPRDPNYGGWTVAEVEENSEDDDDNEDIDDREDDHGDRHGDGHNHGGEEGDGDGDGDDTDSDSDIDGETIVNRVLSRINVEDLVTQVLSRNAGNNQHGLPPRTQASRAAEGPSEVHRGTGLVFAPAVRPEPARRSEQCLDTLPQLLPLEIPIQYPGRTAPANHVEQRAKSHSTRQPDNNNRPLNDTGINVEPTTSVTEARPPMLPTKELYDNLELLLGDDDVDPQVIAAIFADQANHQNDNMNPGRGDLQARHHQTFAAGDESPRTTIEDVLPKVLEILPDICPDFVRQRFIEYSQHLPFVDAETILSDVLNNSSYPRRKKGSKRRRDEARQDEDVLNARCPPTQYTAASRTLQKQFPYMRASQISYVLHHASSIYETIMQLKKIEQNSDNASDQTIEPLRKRRRAGIINVDQIADPTLRVQFQAAQRRISQDEEAERLRKAKIEEDELATKRAFELKDISQCKCCYDDFPNAKMVVCDGEMPHTFCFDCLSGHVNAQLDFQKHQIHCMDSSDCKALFSRTSKQRALDDKTFERLERMQQQNELRDAGLPLSHCPFCDFAAICPPVDEDRELRCQGPDCGITSCRLCKQKSHLPLTCEEYKIEQGVDERHQIEEEMTKAFLRMCPKCNIPILKDGGCNKITCTRCQSYICDVCGKDITQEGYGHFGKQCPQVDTVRTGPRAARRVQEAEKAAREQVLRENPDLSEKDLEIKVSEAVKREEATTTFDPAQDLQLQAMHQARAALAQRQREILHARMIERARRAVAPPPVVPQAEEWVQTAAGIRYPGFPLPTAGRGTALPPAPPVPEPNIWTRPEDHYLHPNMAPHAQFGYHHHHVHHEQHPYGYVVNHPHTPCITHPHVPCTHHQTPHGLGLPAQMQTGLRAMPQQIAQPMQPQNLAMPANQMSGVWDGMNGPQAASFNFIQQRHNAMAMNAMQQNQVMLRQQQEVMARTQCLQQQQQQQQQHRQQQLPQTTGLHQQDRCQRPLLHPDEQH